MSCSRQQSSAKIRIMSEWNELTKALDVCYSLFLQDIGEPQENVLRLVLVEGKRNPQGESLEIAGHNFEDLHRIEPTDDSRTLELSWPQYVAYSVTNESYGKPEGRETQDSGRLLRRYTSSNFLDYVARSTITTDEYPGAQIHVRVLSENHVVDVVSTGLPILRFLSR
jgi:hypothetical protein